MNKTNSQTSFAGRMSKKKYAAIILIILAITVGHFTIQMAFIESENKNIAESLAKNQPILEQNPKLKIDEPEGENISPDLELKKTDVVLPPQPLKTQKITKAEKIVQKEPIRSSAILPPKRNSLKKEFKNESKAERLRRAEMILTGF